MSPMMLAVVMPRCSVVMPRCSVVMPRCSVVMARCSVVMPRCSVGMPRCSVGMPRCSVVMPRCCVDMRSSIPCPDRTAHQLGLTRQPVSSEKLRCKRASVVPRGRRRTGWTHTPQFAARCRACSSENPRGRGPLMPSLTRAGGLYGVIFLAYAVADSCSTDFASMPDFLVSPLVVLRHDPHAPPRSAALLRAVPAPRSAVVPRFP